MLCCPSVRPQTADLWIIRNMTTIANGWVHCYIETHKVFEIRSIVLCGFPNLGPAQTFCFQFQICHMLGLTMSFPDTVVIYKVSDYLVVHTMSYMYFWPFILSFLGSWKPTTQDSLCRSICLRAQTRNGDNGGGQQKSWSTDVNDWPTGSRQASIEEPISLFAARSQTWPMKKTADDGGNEFVCVMSTVDCWFSF